MDERTAPAEIPDRYHYAVVPHIMVDDAAAAIDFGRLTPGAARRPSRATSRAPGPPARDLT
ncbi:hypothetical protein ACIRIU_02845 [Streptomyces sp. NPDC102351]|uniref:hypothetical protein n=1 Tax=Streptomyces sp. NPDC102351 TaxID=3366158 RepID=UPI003821B027